MIVLTKLALIVIIIFSTFATCFNEAASYQNENLQIYGEDFYTYFVREAPMHPGDYKTSTSVKDIQWIDFNLLQRGSYYFRNKFIGISLSHLYSLIEVIALKSTTSVLLSTGHFDNYAIAGSRLLKTVVHVREWCSSGMNILDPTTNASKLIQIVKNRHRSAAYTFKENNIVKKLVEYERIGKHKELVKAIHADLAHVDTRDAPMHLLHWNSTLPVGQFDLAVVQFLFYYHSTVNPEAFGIMRSTSNEDRRAFIHLWAVLGRLLGIQDRFNVALNLPPDRLKHFYANIVVANLKNIDDTVISLMSHTMEGWYATFLVPTVLRLKCWLFYALSHSVDGFTGQNIRRLMNLEDEVCLLYISATASALNEIMMVNNVSKLVFSSWFSQELERLGVTH